MSETQATKSNKKSKSNGKATTNELVAIEVMRASLEVARMVIDRFPQMVSSAAALLRAVDDAGLLRQPLDHDAFDREDDTDAFDLSAMATELATPGRMTMSKYADRLPVNVTQVIPPIAPAAIHHFVAVHDALTPLEAQHAREIAMRLTAAELGTWFNELSKLTVEQAAQKVRVLLAGNTEALS